MPQFSGPIKPIVALAVIGGIIVASISASKGEYREAAAIMAGVLLIANNLAEK